MYQSKKMASFCLYTTSYAQAYAAAAFINWIIPLVISAASFMRDEKTGRVGRQFTMLIFGFYLFIWQYVLYTLQTAIHAQRPDPFCPSMMTDGFPSSAAFHVAVGGTLIISLAWLLEFSFSWMTYVGLPIWFLAGPSFLVWFGFNSWQEIVISICLGILATLAYFVTLKFYLIDMMPYILNSAPFTWFYCLDTWLQDARGQQKTEDLRKMLE